MSALARLIATALLGGLASYVAARMVARDKRRAIEAGESTEVIELIDRRPKEPGS